MNKHLFFLALVFTGPLLGMMPEKVFIWGHAIIVEPSQQRIPYRKLVTEICSSVKLGCYEPGAQGALVCCLFCTGLFCCAGTAPQIVPHYYEASCCCATSCGLFALCLGVCSEPYHYRSTTRKLCDQIGHDTGSALQALGRVFCCRSQSGKEK